MTQSLEDLKKKARGKYPHGEFLGITTYHLDSKELDTLIEQVYNARTEEVVEIVEGMKGRWFAVYMPATDEENPSKGGFSTEDDAWDWIYKRLTPCPLDPKDKSSEPCDSCLAEWNVWQDEDADRALTDLITKISNTQS